jgi:hypothetical protein
VRKFYSTSGRVHLYASARFSALNLGRQVTSAAEHLEGLCTNSQDRELASNDAKFLALGLLQNEKGFRWSSESP